jgi:ubiquitin-activating enzyme E1
MFVKPAQAVNAYLSEPNYLESTLKYSGQQREQVEQIVSYLVTNKPLTFEECIVWARLQFEDKYNNAIRQLLFSLPKDAVTSTGQPFWSGPKRAPDPLTFNSGDVSPVYHTYARTSQTDATTQPVHLGFIIAAANLHAFNYGLRGETDENVFRKIADAVIVPEFTPKSGVKIQVNENEPVAESGPGEYHRYLRQHGT